MGHFENVHVDDDGRFRFVEVAVGGFMGLGKEHHLVPIEAVGEVDHDSVSLTLDRRTARSAPTWGDPHAAPDGTMFVRVTTVRVLEGQFDRMLRFYREFMVPATEMQAGFRGGVMISDRSASKIVTASWWDSQARMPRIAQGGTSLA